MCAQGNNGQFLAGAIINDDPAIPQLKGEALVISKCGKVYQKVSAHIITFSEPKNMFLCALSGHFEVIIHILVQYQTYLTKTKQSSETRDYRNTAWRVPLTCSSVRARKRGAFGSFAAQRKPHQNTSLCII